MGGARRGTRLTQREAAERLGVSVEAVRKRIKRRTLGGAEPQPSIEGTQEAVQRPWWRRMLGS